MYLKRFMITVGAITCLSLVYIYLQIQIYDLGYQGESKRTDLQRHRDIHGDIMNDIYQLKSANHLGEKILSNNSHMKFLDSRHIVKLETPVQIAQHSGLESRKGKPLAQKMNPLASLLTLKSQAEAEPVK